MTSDIYKNCDNGKGEQFSTLIFNKFNLSWFSFVLTELYYERTFTQLKNSMVCKSINKIKNLLYKNKSQDKIKGELFVLSSNLFHYVDIRVHKATDGHYVCGFKKSIQQLHKKIKQTLNLLS